MNKTVISVQINGPGRLAQSTVKSNRKPRPKAAFLHTGGTVPDRFTSGMSSVTVGELRDYFPSPVPSAPANYESLHRSYSTQAMESPRDIDDDDMPTIQGSAFQTSSHTRDINDNNTDLREHYSKFYYRYYPKSQMTEAERKRLHYIPCKTPTILRQKPDGPKTKAPPRWHSATSLRRTAYHLAELSLENEQNSTSVRPSINYQLKMLTTDQDDDRKIRKKPRAKSCYTQTSLRSASTPLLAASPQQTCRPVSSFVRGEANTAMSSHHSGRVEPQTLAGRHFQKRNELLRQQLQIYIHWKAEQQLKERRNMATGEAYREESKKPRLLTSCKERRLQLFSDVMNETENELKRDLEEQDAECCVSTEFIDDTINESGLNYVDKERELTDWLSKGEVDENNEKELRCESPSETTKLQHTD